MDTLRAVKKAGRKMKRQATRSVHEALHSICEEEGDIQKIYEHLAAEHEDCTSFFNLHM